MTDWKWELCVMCGAMIICPKCGQNTCSGGYGQVDGKDCDVCPQAYDEYLKAYKENRVPRLPGDSLEERSKVLMENRKRLEEAGVRFATEEDLRSI